MNTQAIKRKYLKLASHIKRERLKQDITQKQLAEMTKLTEMTIYNIEAGKAMGTYLQNILKICEALGIDVTTQKKSK